MISLIIAVILVVITDAQVCNYSSVCADHTMCKYPTATFGAMCRPPFCSGVNTADQQQIVNLHNELRRRVVKGLETKGLPGPQPTAANMCKMEWDNELATIAQRLAYQCNFQHDTCRSVARFYAGQNLVLAGDFTANCAQNWTLAVQLWYDEVKDFSRNNICPFQYTSGTGHYSQVVWANTCKVGCGFTAYYASDGLYRKLYACNYGPGGNVIGGGSCIYKPGSPCTQCPAGSGCVDGLCVYQ